jgi:hypothetical protein
MVLWPTYKTIRDTDPTRRKSPTPSTLPSRKHSAPQTTTKASNGMLLKHVVQVQYIINIYGTSKHLKFQFFKILKKIGSLEDKPSHKSTNRWNNNKIHCIQNSTRKS